jgi:glucose/arabinose dehydrogenase
VTYATRRSVRRPLTIIGALALVMAVVGPATAEPMSPVGLTSAERIARLAETPSTSTAVPAALEPAITMSLPVFRSGLSQPIFATNAGDGTGRVYIVEKAGRIKVLNAGAGYLGTLLNITDRTSKGGEQGLLGLAFHPDWETNRKFYVNYTDRGGDTRIVEYRASANGLSTVGGRSLLTIAQPYSNHNGGMLAFDDDGLLYIATGDGGSAGDPGNRAQNLNSLLGKILRIDPDTRTGSLPYGIPGDNPYVGRTGNDLIYLFGLRNPWRFSFDRLSGNLWIGDVGQGRYEEIDRSTAAGVADRKLNFGWREFEGNACYRPSSGCSVPGYVPPVHVYSHSGAGGGNCSVTGGYVYRGDDHPALQGLYLFADVCSGRIWSLNADSASGVALVRDTSQAVVSFGEAEDGELFLVSLSGTVFRIAAS